MISAEHAPPRGGRWQARAVIGGTALGVLALLFFFSPESHGFYPRCLFYVTTGWQCPGCGGLRAAHHLLHGEVAVAFHYNALLVSLLPFVPLWLAAPVFKRRTGLSWLDFTRSRSALTVLLIVAAVFGVLRNILH